MPLLPASKSDQKITVTKIEAVKRQLTTAIKLWFMEDDPVSIYALLSATHEIVHALYRKGGFSGLLFDSKIIKDEYRSDFAKLIKKPTSFFKHAQKERGSTIEFNPMTNEMLILVSIVGLGKFEGNYEHPQKVFLIWLALHRPDLTELGKLFVDQMPIDLIEKLRAMERSEFFKVYEDFFIRGERAPMWAHTPPEL